MPDARRGLLQGVAAALLLIAGPACAQALPALRGADISSPPSADATTSAATPGRGAQPSRLARPAGATPPPAIDLAARPGLEGLRGGGDPAPQCRARCAPAFYTCVAGSAGDGECHLALAVCRRGCDAVEPPPGRLQSPLPAAGLAPAGALRPLAGGLPALQ